MLGLIALGIFILWLLGYIQVSNIFPLPVPDLTLMAINGQPITLWNLLIFFLILAAVALLPSPFRQIGSVLLVLWLLSLFGILAIGGLSTMIVWAIILGLVSYVFFGSHTKP
jgi:hypothetical protein